MPIGVFSRFNASPNPGTARSVCSKTPPEMQGSFSEPSLLLSFQPSREDYPPNPNLPSTPFQKNVPDMPARRYGMANGSPLRQLQPRPVGSCHETMKFPASTHPGQVLTTGPPIEPQTPVTSSVLLPTAGRTAMFPVSCPEIGSQVPRETGGGTISPAAMTQLTIFFAGSVSVYDNVSPEKAQAILLSARSSSSASPLKPVTVTQVQSQSLGPSLDGVCAGKSPSMLPSSSSLVHTQPVNTKHSIMNVPTLVQAVAIPQARKVSLSRFLEQRKERMIKASPYGSNNRSLERGGIPSGKLSHSGGEFHGINPQL
ncbi:hypothetical protein MLD38_038272 [Melastoma candidum]|uniref:Uncharacterized protein n=1 Tax=Melastoma candidum TaxID=119954 RepID=A0ACB9KZK7_9MYRT|nr:hypothetical protein MLD38_038272 [Melastoma candidum]